jgi:hypothetical protein
MSHSGPFRCMCGQIHFDQFDGPSNDLLPYVDLTAVTALNAQGDGTEAAQRIFKPYDQRLQREACLHSEDDDPQLIIKVPFTCPVQIRAFTLVGGGDGEAPCVSRIDPEVYDSLAALCLLTQRPLDLDVVRRRTARFFINHETLDFSDAEDSQPVQAWDLVEDATGAIEYPTQFSRFHNVSVL